MRYLALYEDTDYEYSKDLGVHEDLEAAKSACWKHARDTFEPQAVEVCVIEIDWNEETQPVGSPSVKAEDLPPVKFESGEYKIFFDNHRNNDYIKDVVRKAHNERLYKQL